MKALSAEFSGKISGSSMIRRMFEAGIELKKKYGVDNVYDFSLGNPDLAPPPEVKKAILEIGSGADQPFSIGYMPNVGYPETRAALAAKVSEEQGAATPPDNIVVTCGAAGGLNVLFRAILEPGDEVICPSPYFVEYGSYAGNFGGKLVPVPARLPDFSLDTAAMEAAMTPRTRAVIINSPNNPTGQIYTESELRDLAAAMKRCSEKNGRPVYLVSDEPYRTLNYEDAPIPSVFSLYDASVVVGSFSKSLSLAGERVGYLAVCPSFGDAGELVAGLILANRILGFVNAPAVGQRILQTCLSATVDVAVYRRRREMMADVLRAAGIDFVMPRGAFYFFAKSPVPDDRAFVDELVKERVLVVPGSGFGLSGYVRIAFCVEDSVIKNSADGFARAVKACTRA